jgi:chromosome segregation ATPase
MSDAFLEALKSMGRMDGDMIDSAGETRTIEGWRQECERLRGLGDLVVKLQAERQGWLDRIKANDATYDSLQRECERLKAQVDELEGRHIAFISEYNDRVFERDKFKAECERLRGENDKLKEQSMFLHGQVNQLAKDRDTLTAERHNFHRERQGWFKHANKMETSADNLRQEIERLQEENERLKRQLAQADRNCEELQAEREAAKRLRDEANAKCEQLRRAQRGDVTAGENEALRIIIRHLAKLL